MKNHSTFFVYKYNKLPNNYYLLLMQNNISINIKKAKIVESLDLFSFLIKLSNEFTIGVASDFFLNLPVFT